jgi:hypothetical protein
MLHISSTQSSAFSSADPSLKSAIARSRVQVRSPVLIVVGDLGDEERHAARADIVERALRRSGIRHVRTASLDAPTAIHEELPWAIVLFGDRGLATASAHASGLPTLSIRSAADGDVDRPRAAGRVVHLVCDAPDLTAGEEGAMLIGPLVASEAPDDDAICEAARAIVEILEQVLETNRASAAAEHPPAESTQLTRDELVRYVRATAPIEIDDARVPKMLAQADALGLPRWETAEGTRYDRLRSWTWLYERSPAFFADLATAWMDARRAASPPRGRASDRHTGPRRLVRTAGHRVRLELSYAVDLSGIERGTPLRAFLPFPIANEAQRDIRLVSCDLPAMAESLLADAGYFYGACLSVPDSGVLEARYTAELSLYETHAQGFPEIDGEHHALWARFASSEALVDFARGIADPFVRAAAIHSWIIGRARFKKLRLSCLCGSCSVAAIDRERAGFCVSLANAFVHLCERVGVRARPVRGSILTFRAKDGFGADAVFEPVVGHTWAEFEVPGVGFVPVELDPITLKPTSMNCGSADLHAAVRTELDAYRAFCFGNLDGLHVVFSSSALDLPTFAIEDRHAPEGQRWTPVPMRRMSSSIRVRRVGRIPEAC